MVIIGRHEQAPRNQEQKNNMRDRRFAHGLQKMLDMVKIERVESNFKEIYDMLDLLGDRYRNVTAQQFSLVRALEHGRKLVDPNDNRAIRTLSQVSYYANYLNDHKTHKRICNLFIELTTDLNDYRKILYNIIGCEKKKNPVYVYNFALWKRVLDPEQDISNLHHPIAVKYCNKLNALENRKLYHGVISVLPVAMDCARKIRHQIDHTKTYQEQMRTFNTCEELRRLVEYNDSRVLRKERCAEFNRRSKWQMPNRQLAKIKLDDIGKNRTLRDHAAFKHTVGTQSYSLKPKRKFGVDRCKEHFDLFGFPVRFYRGTGDDSLPETPKSVSPTLGKTNMYTPSEIIAAIEEQKVFKKEHQPLPRNHFTLKTDHRQPEVGTMTKKKWRADPSKQKYKDGISAVAVEPLMHDFIVRQNLTNGPQRFDFPQLTPHRPVGPKTFVQRVR